jgi:hypothetical protein
MSSAKQSAKDRDNWKCRFCGMTNEEHKKNYEKGLHAHHIVKDGDGGADKPENLITVCRDCHNTLETTQADALSRIKQQHKDQTERIEELERRLEHAKRKLKEERQVEHRSFVWDESPRITVHVLIEGALNGVSRVYVDKQRAVEAYENCDSHAALRSHTVNYEDSLEDSIRAVSTVEHSVMFNGRDSSDYFEDVESYSPETFLSADVDDLESQLPRQVAAELKG